MSSNKTQVVKDLKEKSIVVSRELNAELNEVWRAHTEKELLDQWWGPSPWRAETKTHDFKPGGYWLYAMVGPKNERHWARMNYKAIDPQKSIQIEDVFCDENGNATTNLPSSTGSLTFTKTERGTRVEFKMFYTSEEDVQKIIDTGFEQGITICYDQLGVLLTK